MRRLPLPAFSRRSFTGTTLMGVALFAAFSSTSPLRADQIEMKNGDRFSGTVVAYTNNVIVLTNSSLGVVSIHRTNLERVVIGLAVTNASPKTVRNTTASILPGLPTNSLASAIRNSDKSSTADQAAQVKQQLLGDADPAAKAKFDEMLGDMMSGKMSMGDLRAQAVSAAAQLRQLKKELGPQSDDTLDGYLTVLESFIKEVPADSPVTRTNNVVAPITTKED